MNKQKKSTESKDIELPMAINRFERVWLTEIWIADSKTPRDPTLKQEKKKQQKGKSIRIGSGKNPFRHRNGGGESREIETRLWGWGIRVEGGRGEIDPTARVETRLVEDNGKILSDRTGQNSFDFTYLSTDSEIIERAFWVFHLSFTFTLQ